MHNKINPILHIKEGDTRPTLEFNPDVDNLNAANQVRVYVEHEKTGNLVVNEEANIAGSTIAYRFDKHQTLKRGRHLAEFVIHWSDGVQTVPADTFLAVDIHRPIDRDMDPTEWDDQDASVSVLSIDDIWSNSTGEVTIHDPASFEQGASVGDMELSDDGDTGSITYGNGALEIDDNGVSVPTAPSQDQHVARLADIGEGGTGDVSNPMQAHLDANGYTIENLKDPVASGDAATKGYVDTEISNIDTSGGSTSHSGVVYADEHGYPGDRSGGDIAPLINNNLGKKIVFPPGEYVLESEISLDATDGDLLYLAGEPEATIVPNDSTVGHVFVIGTTSQGFQDVRLENLTLLNEGTSSSNATWGRAYISGTFITENLRIEGQVNRIDYENDRYALLSNMVTEDAVGIHRGLHFGDGEIHDTSSTNVGQTIGFAAEEYHVGTNILIGCHLNEWADNGYYVKDGTGANVLQGCTAQNCGGANFRIGINDIAIGCESVWDGDPDTLKNGVCFDSDEADGTSVIDLRVIKNTGVNDCVRIRSSSNSVTFRDAYIENNTDQWSISARGTGTELAVFDNCTVIDSGTTNVRSAAVEVRRPEVHFHNSTVKTTDGTTSRSGIEVNDGSCVIHNCYLDIADPGYGVEIDAVDRVTVSGTTTNAGIYIISQPTALQVIDNDMRNVTDPFPGSDPTMSERVWRDNLGHLGTTY